MFGHRSITHAADHREAIAAGRMQQKSTMVTAQLDHIGKLRTKDVRAGTELRLTVAPDEDLFLRAHSRIPDTFATAEIFGMELVMGHEYKIERGTSVAIFSWHGCTIELRGTTVMEYDASNQAMRDFVNLAGVIEQKRQRAEEMGTDPPRVLVTGSELSGKSTLGLFLCNLALRRHRRPIYVELDPGSISTHRQLPSVPGSISAIHIDNACYELNSEPVHPHRINLHKGIDQGTPAPHLNPNYPIGRFISFWYGYFDWRTNKELYWKACAQLACLVKAKEELVDAGDEAKERSKDGIIINCPSNPSPDLLDELVRLYSINTVVVIEDEEKFMHFVKKYHGGVIPALPTESGADKLLKSGGGANALIYLDAIEEEEHLAAENPTIALDVAHVLKAGGVISLTEQQGKILHVKFADYFHSPERDLICHNFAVPLRELFILAVRYNPGGSPQSWLENFAVEPFSGPLFKLRHSILAVVLATSLEEVAMAPVAGFVWVRDVVDPEDPINTILHIMSPSAGPLLSNYLLIGDAEELKYFEQMQQ